MIYNIIVNLEKFKNIFQKSYFAFFIRALVASSNIKICGLKILLQSQFFAFDLHLTLENLSQYFLKISSKFETIFSNSQI